MAPRRAARGSSSQPRATIPRALPRRPSDVGCGASEANFACATSSERVLTRIRCASPRTRNCTDAANECEQIYEIRAERQLFIQRNTRIMFFPPCFYVGRNLKTTKGFLILKKGYSGILSAVVVNDFFEMHALGERRSLLFSVTILGNGILNAL